MVRTGANAYVKYGYEDAYGAGASPALSFGLKTAVTGWTLTTNRTALAALGQVEPTTFAYGQQSGTLGVGFVLGDTTSHNIFQAIYGKATDSGTDKVYGSLTAGGAAKEMNPEATADDGSCIYEGDACDCSLDAGLVNGGPINGSTTEAYDVVWYSFTVDQHWDNLLISLIFTLYLFYPIN